MSKEKSFLEKALDALASLKLTLFVFFTLAAASIIGTLLPQGTSTAEMQGQFSPTIISIIDQLGLNNLYHTSWFMVLLLLLCLNLLVCTLDRLPKTIKLLKRQEETFDSRKLSKFSYSASFTTGLSAEEARGLLHGAVADSFGPLHELKSEGAYCAVNEKGRWSRLMVYGVHASVLLVLLGALAGSRLGFEGFMNLPEGATSGEVIMTGGHSFIDLPFKVRCDKFEVSLYDTGAPKEYRSDLTIVEDGREVLKQSILVNDPLTYKGVTFYQASYGATLKDAEIELKERDSGKTITMTLPYQENRTIPGTDEQIRIAEYQENLMRFGPALGLVLGKVGQDANSGSYILVDHPEFHGNRVQNYQVRVLKTTKSHYTGLQVRRDPGVWLVYLGFILMLVGIGLTFYSSHNKIWACIEPGTSGTGALVSIAGRSSRNTPGFAESFEELSRRLTDQLKPEKMKEVQKKK
ncbi:MAG: cytochrome c biogenesis protein ResB [Syntrophobacter sp.]